MQISALHPANLIFYLPVKLNSDLCPSGFLPAAATYLLWYLGGGQAGQLKKPDVRVYNKSFQQWQLLVRSRSPEGFCLALTVYLLVAMAGLPESRVWDQLPVGNSSFFSWKTVSTDLQLWENVLSLFSYSQGKFMFNLYKSELSRKGIFYNFWRISLLKGEWNPFYLWF